MRLKIKVRIDAWNSSQLEQNITGFLRDFKRARYQKLAFVEIYRSILPKTKMNLDVLAQQ